MLWEEIEYVNKNFLADEIVPFSHKIFQPDLKILNHHIQIWKNTLN